MQNKFRDYKLDRVKEVTVICDRCKAKVVGFQNGMGTSGFYNVKSLMWQQYADSPDESIVCDACMRKHPRYRINYNLD